MKNKTHKYRIVKVIDDPLWGTYFKVQYYGGHWIFKSWKDYYFHVNGSLEHEFRCHTFEDAQERLEICKKSAGSPYGSYEEIVYQE